MFVQKKRNVDFFPVIQPQRNLFTEISTIESAKTGIVHKNTVFVS